MPAQFGVVCNVFHHHGLSGGGGGGLGGGGVAEDVVLDRAEARYDVQYVLDGAGHVQVRDNPHDIRVGRYPTPFLITISNDQVLLLTLVISRYEYVC